MQFNQLILHVETNQYTLSQLASIFYATATLRRSNDKITNALKRKIGYSDKEIRTNDIFQILSGLNHTKVGMTIHGFMLLETLLAHVRTKLKEFSLEEKSLLFKQISKLETHTLPNNFELSDVITYLYSDFINEFDQLGEVQVLNIIDGYCYLPIDFRSALLDNIKDMVVQSVQVSPENI